MATAEILILLAQVYTGLGCLLAVPFLLWGIDRIDEGTHGSYLFRILLIPGAVGLWPLVLGRWLQLERAR